jgi:hypothetical protein
MKLQIFSINKLQVFLTFLVTNKDDLGHATIKI